MSEEEAFAAGTEAYVYGYPLVTTELTRRVMTNAERPEGTHAPMGAFVHQATYPNASFKDVTAPNADTLYSTAWLDLTKEPYVLHIPDMGDRYYLMPLLSGWTEVFGNPGKRTTGSGPADFAITGPDFKGPLPNSVKEIKSPTQMVWIIGRTYSTGTKQDYAEVHRLQQQYALTPLSAFGKPFMPRPGKVDPNVDMKTPVRDQVNRMDGALFFKTLAEAMRANPPSPADAPMLSKLARLGVAPGRYSPSPAVAQAMTRVPQAAQEKIKAAVREVTHSVNGWVFANKVGNYGTAYLDRAFVAAVGLGANRVEDAIYPTVNVDSRGQKLSGSSKYVVRFPKGQLPPVNGFWSITMYDSNMFFVDNPLNKYTVSARDALKQNPDGSVEVLIQNESPGKDKQANWLPAPKDSFVLMMRLYWPKEEVVRGEWKPPAVEQALGEGVGGSPPTPNERNRRR